MPTAHQSPRESASHQESTLSDIVIRGAREHNLRDVELVLPRNKLICLTGVSGSGKSSLAFDTLYAEGQRRYVESLSSFARQFLGQMPKPDVDLISGLSPSISISQKSSGNNPRSTVGTITEIYDYLRVLFARVGQGYCPQCERPISAQSQDQIIASILQRTDGLRFLILAPLIRGQKGEHRDLFADLLKQGFLRVRVDGQLHSLSQPVELDRSMRHDIEVVVDRLENRGEGIRGRLAEAVENALKIGRGNLLLLIDATERPDQPLSEDDEPADARRGTDTVGETVYSESYACTHCNLSFDPPTPQKFSFNSPQGMCNTCHGMGELYTFTPELLIPDASLSFKKGCVELLGNWKTLGRWRRHIYQGVADTLERTREMAEGSVLETPWSELDPAIQHALLWGTGDLHITFTWRGGNTPMKYGGKFEGIIPDLLGRYHSLKSAPKQRQLEQYMDNIECAGCRGDRINEQARFIRLDSEHPDFSDRASLSLPAVCRLSVKDCANFFSAIQLDSTRTLIAAEALKEIRARLGFLLNVGLEYLTLDRTAPTLSGGESQRIRLASQIGSGLVGVLYILDEPSIGLHSRDNDRLIGTLHRLRDLGNTVVVVEHDEDTMRAADHIVDFGPGPGVGGGHVVAQGPPESVAEVKASVTGQYLAGQLKIDVPDPRRPVDLERSLSIFNASHNNLKNVDVHIPLGAFVCITGVSGSGKSSLVNGILVEALREQLNRGEGEPGPHDRIEGLELLDKMIAIDQSPIGRTPRSNPGTYVKVFDEIRKLFARMPEAKRRGYTQGRFSFNVKSGRCSACDGNGANKLEMDFLADLWVTCPVCRGQRFNRETLQVTYKDKTIADVLNMDIKTALEFFENIPTIFERLSTLEKVGLDYLQIGQPSPTLSGGEAQRIKLARELTKKSTGKTFYLLDEPTTGLHFADIRLLLKVLHNFVETGNTVLVVEHNLDVIKTADWVIDLGPEGGAGGGRIVAQGTPETIAACDESETGRALRRALDLRPISAGNIANPAEQTATGIGATDTAPGSTPRELTHIRVKDARQHNLKGVDVEIPRDQMTVFCGPSGSGKSSLAMDTIYAEGQRRYVESLSSYARQFVNQMQKPNVENIDGLSPAIAIEQKNFGSTPRSTVGTVTEVYDFLRILFARLGKPHCPDCGVPIGTQTADQIVDKILSLPSGTRLYVMAPAELDTGQTYDELWEEFRSAGYARIRVDGQTFPVDQLPSISNKALHNIEIVLDRVEVKPSGRTRLADSVEAALSLGAGVLHVAVYDANRPEIAWQVVRHSQHLACDRCGESFEPLSPHNFSFNSQLGWCPDCEGLGTQEGADPAALINDAHKTLSENALKLWPELGLPYARAILQALSRETGIPLDVPIEQLSARHRRILFFGTGSRWISYHVDALGEPVTDAKLLSAPGAENEFRELAFQYRGLFPAINSASRLSPSLRQRMLSLVGIVECGSCFGSRLRNDSAAVQFRGLTIDEVCRLPLGKLMQTVNDWDLDSRESKIAGEIIREVTARVQFLNDVGLQYLTLGRTANTLSNGEAQRIRLASQLGSGLCGVLYVLDEPTIGLHPRDNTRLIQALHRLKQLGNTLLVVEHDREVIDSADAICDFGPEAGVGGGRIVAHGSVEQVMQDSESVTGPYLSGGKAIPMPANRRPVLGEQHRWSGVPVVPTDSASGSSEPPRKSKRPRAGKSSMASASRHLPSIENGESEFRPLRRVSDQRIAKRGIVAGHVATKNVAGAPDTASRDLPRVAGRVSVSLPAKKSAKKKKPAARSSKKKTAQTARQLAVKKSATASSQTRKKSAKKSVKSATSPKSATLKSGGKKASKTSKKAASSKPVADNQRATDDNQGTPTTPAKQKSPRGKKTAARSQRRSTASSAADGTPLRLPEIKLAQTIDIIGARHNNLRDLTVSIPLETLTVVTGPSGCGKSSLVNNVLYHALASRLHRASLVPGAHDRIRGIEAINKVIRVDQTPLGNSPSSNPATYTGVFELIRELFAQLPDAKVRGYAARRFSFNVPGGRCEECQGNGQKCIEMHFLPDVWVECETCAGQRYNSETLDVKYHGHNINDVLEMACSQALELFSNIPRIRRILKTLCDVGLDYVQLGQSAPTLSGGEAQRVKLAAELARPDTGQTLYILDEPTTGLHFDDLLKLLEVLQRLVDVGNTVLCIEHNLDIIKCADWVIDLGPDAGDGGGELVACGTPEMVAAYGLHVQNLNGEAGEDLPPSHTGVALAEALSASYYQHREAYDPQHEFQPQEQDLEIDDLGASAKMPWQVDGRRWHVHDRVGRQGEQVKWSGELLEKLVDHIERSEYADRFAATDWNSRSVVEIASEKKSQGWFFHALTGDAWLLKLKFRVRRGSFKQPELEESLQLPTLNQLDEVPKYGNTSRVQVSSAAGTWQEIEIKAYLLEELDQPAFWSFVDQAMEKFFARVEHAESNIEKYTPWAQLGQKWHFLRKGFAPGRKVEWPADLVEQLCGLISKTAEDAQFLWSNKQVVHVYVPQQKEPWASLWTKKNDALWLYLNGPSRSVPLGRVAELSKTPSVSNSGPRTDVVRLAFDSADEITNPDLAQFLKEHLELVIA